jgi:hypothetical protein
VVQRKRFGGIRGNEAVAGEAGGLPLDIGTASRSAAPWLVYSVEMGLSDDFTLFVIVSPAACHICFICKLRIQILEWIRRWKPGRQFVIYSHGMIVEG